MPNEKYLQLFSRLSLEQWNRIFKYQLGRCAICKRIFHKPNVDHQHGGDNAGFIRGLLCYRCNRTLGWIGDTPLQLVPWLQNALQYVMKPPATEALGLPHYGLPGRWGTKKARKLARKLKKDLDKKGTL